VTVAATKTFALDVAAFVEKAGKNADLVMRKVALDVFTRVVLRTPVDTGRARGNWILTVGTARIELPAKAPLDPTGKRVVEVYGRLLASYTIADGPISIRNRLPYIVRLEDGYSGQAPSGMVAVTVREYQGLVKRAVDEVKR